jgi:hypothetical protein
MSRRLREPADVSIAGNIKGASHTVDYSSPNV